ncbi:extracellular solute-binding protein [Cyanobacterium sp. IPPAS B-1200]|uniref:extracellular solute-binding protein n=1 Tax=Cyanobacterium sp. IPPAS B-1200 TaxID=1562720 RepID=UPI0008526716|nr:extracellular solute-binding protein [Cyanobacterium sp. IPPAS B-1200]OEJ77822.1 polyamine ABC transporter substrate-binding protein [Cyanobacterium sp. IPPAS B-1200]
MNRRSFIITSTALSLGSLVAGCQANHDLKILLLQGSIPVQLIAAFNQELNQGKNINFKPQANLDEIYKLLQKWQGKNPLSKEESGLRLPPFPFTQSEEEKADLVTLGNYWLSMAIENNLIQPLDRDNLFNWGNLPPIFQGLVTRNAQGNMESGGQIWGAPYRWGYTMIAYREDKFEPLGFTPEDWSDLWRVELTNNISLLNQPREIIGLILKKSGYSYNTENITEINEIYEELITLNNQVKFYDSTNYLQPLINGDTWLAVGWSTDILPMLEQHRNIKAVIPRSGTSLWADVWVNPYENNLSDEKLNEIYRWINYCWEKDSATRINFFTKGNSPILTAENGNNKLEISEEIFAKSEFIEPLSPSAIAYYNQLWEGLNS